MEELRTPDDLQEEFTNLVAQNIHREGIEDLMRWLCQTDFFKAPASTRYHGCCEGGLVQHSLNVYAQLTKLCNWYECDASLESITIVALFHDLCKVGCYKTEMRWRKDANNRWEQYPTWKFEEDYCFGGHGAKSVYLIQNFMKLTPEEAAAINAHMGAWDATTYSNPTAVYQRNKLAWLLHVADEAADFIVESKED